MYKPDRIDWEIIQLLNQDGRMPSAEIARQIGDVSARTITNRINQLVKHGIIKVRAVVNPASVGYSVMADVFIDVEPGRVREVAYKVAEFPQVTYAACAAGESDVSISLRVRTIEEFFDFITEIIGKIPGVRRTQSYILPLKIKDFENWLPPELHYALNRNKSEEQENFETDKVPTVSSKS
jgi:Lrp/AsnC family transcriptional regulator for asnA, asnC and gidA